MQRQYLIGLLEDYNPVDHVEKTFKLETLEFIQNNKNCFERTLDIGHITASAWLLNKDHTKALLMHHAKLNRWFQLGGHCDGDADVLNVAVKESREESGINSIEPIFNNIFDIDIHLIPANTKDKEHFHYDIRFLLAVTSNEELVQNKESKELRWIDKDIENLPTDNPSIIRMFNKWLNVKK